MMSIMIAVPVVYELAMLVPCITVWVLNKSDILDHRELPEHDFLAFVTAKVALPIRSLEHGLLVPQGVRLNLGCFNLLSEVFLNPPGTLNMYAFWGLERPVASR